MKTTCMLQGLARIWNKNMGEHPNLYLRTDVILLANIFESFRRVCLENYGLNPSHFYTVPELGWKACLKKTGIRLELLLDANVLLMFERGIRGGITQSVHRWAAANNPYMGSEYDKSKPTKYLQPTISGHKQPIWVDNVSTIANWEISLG